MKSHSGDSAPPATGAAGLVARKHAELKREAASLLREVEHAWGTPWTRHWADVLVIAALLALGSLAYVRTTRAAPPEEVRARVDLPAFALLGAEHLDSGIDDSAARKLVGRYLLRPLRARAPVRAADLGPASLRPELLNGRHALALQLAPGAAPDSLRAGTIASVLLSPAAAGAGAPALVVDRVPVLAAAPAPDGGARVVLGVTRAQLDSIGPRIGSSRVFLLTGDDPTPDWPVPVRPSPKVSR